MDCRQIITSEEYGDFILPRNLVGINELSFPVDCELQVNEAYKIAYAKLPENRQISLEDAGYSAIPKLFGLMDTDSMEQAGILQVLNQPGLALSGRNVLVGMIDTGIDYTHPAFRNPDGTTRILSIWDQTLTDEQAPSYVRYGKIFQQSDIDEALRGENPYEIVESRDENGHGTFLAGIAAGSPEEDGSFTGAVPGASLAVVKLKPAKRYLRDFFQIREDALAYQENDIMLGLVYLLVLAYTLKMPVVILLGLGSNSGTHSGYSPLSSVIRWAADKPQVVVVTAAGNEAGRQHHFQGRIEAEAAWQDVEVRVGEGERGFSMEIWAEAAEAYAISLTSPSGEVIPPISPRFGRSQELSFIFEQTRAYVDYEIIHSASGQFLILIRLFQPTPGLWNFRLYNTNFLTGTYHIWLPIEGFVEPDTVFLQADPYVTLTVPAAAQGSMVICCYDHRNGSLYLHSSRGFTPNQAVKPDLAAPGVNVYGPRAGGGYTSRTGTSVSAAHAAGASALLLEWAVGRRNQLNMNSAEATAYFIRSARRNPALTYPNREWGYGMLDLYGVFEQMAEGRF